jgi:hypothetical protein
VETPLQGSRRAPLSSGWLACSRSFFISPFRIFGRLHFLSSRNVESYAQQMEYQDNEPSDNATDRADEHGKHVDGYVVAKNEVSEE